MNINRANDVYIKLHDNCYWYVGETYPFPGKKYGRFTRANFYGDKHLTFFVDKDWGNFKPNPKYENYEIEVPQDYEYFERIFYYIFNGKI